MKKTINQIRKDVQSCSLQDITFVFDNILYQDNIKKLEHGQNLYWMVAYEDLKYIYEESDYYLYKLKAFFDSKKFIEMDIAINRSYYKVLYQIMKYELVLKQYNLAKNPFKDLYKRGYFNELIRLYLVKGIDDLLDLEWVLGAYFVLKDYYNIINIAEGVLKKKKNLEFIYRYLILAYQKLNIKTMQHKQLSTKYKIMFKRNI